MTFKIFNIQTEQDFKDLALQIFKFQFENNSVYRSFCDLLNVHFSDVSEVEQIPFLPIQFFKSHEILSAQAKPQEIFTSSGTTDSITSKHFVTDISVYEQSYRSAFQYFYGDIKDYVVLALLPNYLERTGSSLIYMVDDLIKKSKNEESGFFLKNHQKLIHLLLYMKIK